MSDETAELEKKKQKKQETMQKNVARHQALWTAWTENSIEIDKQLLVLSTSALGLLVFIHDKLSGDIEKILLLCASFFFSITIIMILLTFHVSQEYIGSVLNENNKDKTKEDKLNSTSAILGISSLYTFGFGVLLTFLMMFFKLGIWAIILRFYQCFLN